MMMPANGHRIQGMTSEKFLDSKEFLDELNLTGSENFMDAGCGDGHVAIKALEEYITDGCVYALDMYEPSIEDMLKYKQENNADNQGKEARVCEYYDRSTAATAHMDSHVVRDDR